MHPIESHLPALNRYAKSLVRGKPHLDYRDIVQEAVLACLVANPEKITEGYLLGACNSRFKNTIKKPLGYELKEDYNATLIEPYDTEEMYEKELLLSWAEYVLAQRCPY